MKLLFTSIFTLSFLGTNLTATAGKTDLTGLWREYKRTTANGKSDISFEDTLMLKFTIGNEYVRSISNGFNYKGTYKIDGKNLMLGAFEYTIAKATDDDLQIIDGAGLHLMRPYTMPEDNNPHAASSSRAAEEIKKTPLKELEDAAGAWEVFKRTSTAVVPNIDYNRILKKVTIYDQPHGDTLGLVFNAVDAPQSPSWYIASFEDGEIIAAGKDVRTITVVSATRKELILEEAEIVYFFKKW